MTQRNGREGWPSAPFLTFRHLGADTLAYGIGGAVAKLIGFVLVLVYTRVFTPEYYGSVEMLNVIGMMLAMLIVTGLDTAQTVFVSQRAPDDESRRDIVSAVLHWKASWGVVAIAVSLLAVPFLNRILFGGALRSGDFAWAFATAYFTSLITQMTDLARLLRRRAAFITISLAQSVLTAIMVLTLLLLFRRGLRGYLEGSCLAAALVAAYAIRTFRQYVVARFRPLRLYSALLRFGLPLLPGGVAMYVLFSSGQWIIASRLGRAEVGIYAVALKFGSVVTLLLGVLQMAWLPYGLEALNSQIGRLFFTQMVLGYTACASLAVTLFGLVAPTLVRLLIPPEYGGSGSMVALGLVAPLFFGFYYLFSIQAILRAGATVWLTILPVCCAALNLLLSLLLVKSWGMLGVIMGTAISAVALALAALHVSLNLEPLTFPERTVQAMAILILATAVTFAAPSAFAAPARYVMVAINVLAAAGCFRTVAYQAMGGRDAPSA